MSYSTIFEIENNIPSEPVKSDGFDINIHVSKKALIYTAYSIGSILLILAVSSLVIFPVVFMLSINLQRLLIFTHFNQYRNKTYYEKFYMPGLDNKYITVKDLDGETDVTLGVWHLLPVEQTYAALNNRNFDYDKALKNSRTSVLLYFHGTGECRSDNLGKYEVFRHYFRVITFDYRCYGDSQPATLSEEAVVNDCVQLYYWLSNNTRAPIYVWGHSLGSAIATKTLRLLHEQKVFPKALILESAFTSLGAELYVHPFVKYISWLPWFKFVTKSLNENGFVFNTAHNIVHVGCPIMLLHAEDDHVVPCKFGRTLFEIAKKRPKETRNVTVYHEFMAKLEYDHNFIYKDPYLQYYLMSFMRKCENNQQVNQENIVSYSIDH